jgi:hypothetical protein
MTDATVAGASAVLLFGLFAVLSGRLPAPALMALTVDSAIVLTTFAVCFYLLWNRNQIFRRLWRICWTVACAALLTHIFFAWSVFFHGDIAAVFHTKSAVRHPIVDMLVATWWGLDAARAWAHGPGSDAIAVRIERGLAHAAVPVVILLATLEQKSPPIAGATRAMGVIMALVILAALVFWACVRRPAPAR